MKKKKYLIKPRKTEVGIMNALHNFLEEKKIGKKFRIMIFMTSFPKRQGPIKNMKKIHIIKIKNLKFKSQVWS